MLITNGSFTALMTGAMFGGQRVSPPVARLVERSTTLAMAFVAVGCGALTLIVVALVFVRPVYTRGARRTESASNSVTSMPTKEIAPATR